MTDTQKDTLASIRAQAVPVLLTVIGFFLIQTNNKIDLAIEKIDAYAINQASMREQILVLQKNQMDLQREVSQMQENVAKFYENYGYLFTESTQKKLTHGKLD